MLYYIRTLNLRRFIFWKRLHVLLILTVNHRDKILHLNLKGTATLMISMFYMKELYEPWILISFSGNSVAKIWKLWAFEYLQMDSNGSGHFVGLVTSHSLIKYA